MLHHALATLTMYYGERFQAEEMQLVLASMRDAYRPIASPTDDAHIILQEWGRAIRTQFDSDNLHLSSRETHAMSDKVLAVVQQLGVTIGRLQAQVTELSGRMASFEQTHEQSLRRIEAHLVRLSSAGGATATLEGGGGETSEGEMEDGAEGSGATSAGGGATSAGGGATSAGGSSSGAAAAPPVATRPPVPPPVAPQLARRDLSGSAQQQEYTFGKLHGGKFFLECMANRGNLPINLTNDRRRSEGKRVLAAYKAMATPEEMEAVLRRPRDEGAAQTTARKLGQLLIKRFKAAYRDEQKPQPKRSLSGSLLVNSVVEHLTKSKLRIDSMQFLQWRHAGASEVTGTVAASAASTAAATANAAAAAAIAAAAAAASSQPSVAAPSSPVPPSAAKRPRESPRPLEASKRRIESSAAEDADDDSDEGSGGDPIDPIVLSEGGSSPDDADSDDSYDADSDDLAG